MAAARAVEYAKITTEARASADLDPTARVALLRRLRAELVRIQRRDYFPPAEHDVAAAAIDALAPTAVQPEEHRP
jgi:hypothetical protein